MNGFLSRRLLRTAAILTAVIAIQLGISLPASADPPSSSGAVERTEHFGGLFAEADGFIVTAGPSMEEACTGQITSIVSIMEVARANGSLSVTEKMNDELRVYEGEDLFTDVLFPSCAAISDGDPLTGPVEPVAVGSGTVSINIVFAEDFSHRFLFSMRGDVVDLSGQEWRILAKVNSTFDSNDIELTRQSSVQLTPIR